MGAIIVFIAKYLYLLALLAATVFFFLQPKETKKSMIVCGVIILPLAYILSRIAGALYNDPRPFVVGHFIPLVAHAPDNGFPSDHVLLTGAVAAVVWFFNKKWSAAIWTFALLIGWARIYGGIHHAADIVWSIAIVIAAGGTYYLALRKRQEVDS